MNQNNKIFIQVIEMIIFLEIWVKLTLKIIQKKQLYILCIFFTLLKSRSFLSVESILSEKKEKERKNMKMFIHVQGNLSQHTRYLHILLCVM